MDMVISFFPAEEKRITTAAKQRGIAPAELVKQITLEQLPPTPANWQEELNAKLHLL